MKKERYLDASASVSERVDDLLKKMTLEEKVGQTLQWNGRDPQVHTALKEWQAGSLLHVLGEDLEKLRLQGEKTSRLKIPLLFGIDAIHGNAFWPGATVFPVQLAQACSWDCELIEKVGRVTAVETAAVGAHWVFSPVFCLARDLRWGRINETYGEDPWLIGELGAALVKGLQTKSLSDPQAVVACAKHYAGYSQTTGGRDASEAVLSRRHLLSTFLPPFKAALDAGCRSLMTAYQSIDGVPCVVNQWLMKEILRKRWAWEGLVVTDWDNVGRLVHEQCVRQNLEDAAVDATACDNDMVMMTQGYFEAALAAVKKGRITEKTIDKLCGRVLALKFELGLFEGKRIVPGGVRQEVIATEAHLSVSLEASRKSLVLLKNKGVLPLGGEKKIGLFGPLADDAANQLGDWSNGSGQAGLQTQGHPRELIRTVADGLGVFAKAKGFELLREPKSEQRPVSAEASLAAERLAKTCDVNVVVVGDTIAQNGECRDRVDLNLDQGQQALLEAVFKSKKPMIVVLITGKPLTIPWVKEHASALVQAFSPGYHGGQAIAELLLGEIEPYGRLPISVARHAAQQPVSYDEILGWHTDKYCDMDAQALWAFGEGLSYTQFEITVPRLDKAEIKAEGQVSFSVEVSNIGKRDGSVLVQAYINDLVSSVTTPRKQLKAYRRAWLKTGEKITLKMAFPAMALALVNAEGDWVLESGAFELMVGLSSRDKDLKKTGFKVLGSA